MIGSGEIEIIEIALALHAYAKFFLIGIIEILGGGVESYQLTLGKGSKLELMSRSGMTNGKAEDFAICH